MDQNGRLQAKMDCFGPKLLSPVPKPCSKQGDINNFLFLKLCNLVRVFQNNRRKKISCGEKCVKFCHVSGCDGFSALRTVLMTSFCLLGIVRIEQQLHKSATLAFPVCHITIACTLFGVGGLSNVPK